MRSIYKYSIGQTGFGFVEDKITKILTAQVQHGDIVVWAEIDTDAPVRKFQFIPVGTGWDLTTKKGDCILDTHTYISTVQLAGGALVFHIYGAEVVEQPVKVRPETIAKAATTMRRSAEKNKTASFAVENSMIDTEILKNFIN